MTLASTITTFEHRRRAMNRMMLFHTCIGHPLAQLCLSLGSQRVADIVHFVTLPRRAKRKLGKPFKFNPDRRLVVFDCFVTPACSLLRALGAYDLAERLFISHPRWSDAVLLGACGYIQYYKAPDGTLESGGQRDDRLAAEATAKLISEGYTQIIQGRRWYWKSPDGRTPTKGEKDLITLTRGTMWSGAENDYPEITASSNKEDWYHLPWEERRERMKRLYTLKLLAAGYTQAIVDHTWRWRPPIDRLDKRKEGVWLKISEHWLLSDGT